MVKLNGIDTVVDTLVWPGMCRMLTVHIINAYKGPRRVFKRKVETFSPFATANSQECIMYVFEIDMSKVAQVLLLVYAMGMAGFFGYMIGKGRGFDAGMNSMRDIYRK